MLLGFGSALAIANTLNVASAGATVASNLLKITKGKTSQTTDILDAVAMGTGAVGGAVGKGATAPGQTGTQGKLMESNPQGMLKGTPGQQRGLEVQQKALEQQNLNPGERLRKGVNNRKILGLDKATETRIDIANNSNYDMDPGSMAEGYSKSDPMRLRRIMTA